MYSPIPYLCCCLVLSLVTGSDCFKPVVYPARVTDQCGQQAAIMDDQLIESLRNINIPQQISPGICTKYLDCKDAYLKGQTTSGIYTIKLDNQTAFQVYCDMDTDGGGWTVLQRRMDGSVNFNRTWKVCEEGFGNLTGEYWLGLIYIHRLTASASQELRVDLEDFESNTAYALYSNFTVAGAADQYRLQVSGYNGIAGDAMRYNSGKQFTTKDRDNDETSSWNCAILHKGPWWHWSCSFSNLNAKYYFAHQSTIGDYGGVTWYDWKNNWNSMKRASMKIRRK